MAPRTRRGVTKTLKENLEIVQKSTVKSGKVTKPTRKPLADKTNSASDDNSIDGLTKVMKTVVTGVIKSGTQNEGIRPRRNRRLPCRFVENSMLLKLSNGNDSPVAPIPKNVDNITPSKSDKSEPSPFKTPAKLETSIVVTRPRRICRLPSRLEDHSISPNKFIPLQPCNASTPIQQKKLGKIGVKDNKVLTKDKPVKNVATEKNKESSKKTIPKETPKPKENNSPDTNNNPKRMLRNQPKKDVAKPSQDKISPLNSKTNKNGKRLLENNFSFKVLEDKKSSNDKSNVDVYEFTFDPTEEPPPQKKKRKKVVKKKPAKPKVVTFKSNYDQNLSKALNALKNVVTKKPAQPANEPTTTSGHGRETKKGLVKEKVPVEILPVASKGNLLAQLTTEVVDEAIVNNHASIQIEDIAADCEPIEDDHHEVINYSPVNSPNRPVSPVIPQHVNPDRPSHNNDPLNLQGDISFFDEQPVASSSMNVSVRHPLASPWRVEFGSLPIKWQSNTYVKANMTPAVESSFIHLDDSNKKKHVYTNLVAETNETLPQIVENNTTNLKQTSIISFIKEAAERSANKRKRDRSLTPSKANSLFEDITNKSHSEIRTPKKVANKANKPRTPNKSSENVSNNSSNTSNENQNSTGEGVKLGNKKATDKDKTYFGFDESEVQDQENVSPVKINPRVKALRPRSRAVLHEINAQRGPMRAALPLAAKTKLASSDAVNKVYEQLKAADAPVFPEKGTGVATTNVNEEAWVDNEDSDEESVHLFEDIALIHHLKPTRKSYGKAKKVTFRQRSNSDEDTENVAQNQADTSDEDDLADLSFHIPSVKEKRTAKKKKNTKKIKISKKEEKEVEEWAAGFNSMCEEIEEHPLIVE